LQYQFFIVPLKYQITLNKKKHEKSNLSPRFINSWFNTSFWNLVLFTKFIYLLIMASQWNFTNVNFALINGKLIFDHGNFKKVLFENLLLSISNNNKIEFAEILVGEKYKICNNPLQIINEFRIKKL